jgi:hypothetical protein
MDRPRCIQSRPSHPIIFLRILFRRLNFNDVLNHRNGMRIAPKSEFGLPRSRCSKNQVVSFIEMGFGGPYRRFQVRNWMVLAATSAVAIGCKIGGLSVPAALNPNKNEASAVAHPSWQTREAQPMPERRLLLLDGLAEGSVQAEIQPKVDCVDKYGIQVCTFEANQGKAADGNPIRVACEVRSDLAELGLYLHRWLGDSNPYKTPEVMARVVGEGFEFRLIANTGRPIGNGTDHVGTIKISGFYVQNYSVVCVDNDAGGRKTFDRVVTSFLASLKFRSHPLRPAFLAQARIVHRDTKPVGFTHTFIQKRATGVAGSDEKALFFQVTDAEKSWGYVDAIQLQVRDTSGSIVRIQSLLSENAVSPIRLSAELAESEKWRLRSIRDGKTNLLEVGNPPDPLSSRIWMAPSLLRLASGELSSLKYSSLELSDDLKPKFLVNSLKRKSIGLIIEEDEDSKSDILVVDEEGFAKTRISGAETQELVYKFGKLP